MKIPYCWTNESIARLGQVSDCALGASLGISPVLIRRKRLQLGIPNHSTQRWSPATIARLGREPDQEIGDSLGISRIAVGIKRRSLGIPPPAKPGPGHASIVQAFS